MTTVESDWSQHLPIHPTSASRPIKSSLVKELPYFHVWFDHNSGLGHVIESPEAWKEWFGREVIGGALDLEASLWRKVKKVGNVSQKIDAFRKDWTPFDWTRALE